MSIFPATSLRRPSFVLHVSSLLEYDGFTSIALVQKSCASASVGERVCYNLVAASGPFAVICRMVT